MAKLLVTGVGWVQWHGESPGRTMVIAVANSDMPILHCSHGFVSNCLEERLLCQRGAGYLLINVLATLMRETEYKKCVTERTGERDEGGDIPGSPSWPPYAVVWKDPLRNGYSRCHSQFPVLDLPREV